MATYYVSHQNGSDENDGLSVDQALATIQTGINKLGSGGGQTLYIGPGTYRETLTTRLNAANDNHNKIIGDSDAIVLTADYPGVVRITYTNEDNYEQLDPSDSIVNDFQITYNTDFYNL